MSLADAANEYVEQQAPWTLKKDPARATELQDVCTVVLNLFHQIVVYLQPVLPNLAAKAGALLGSGCDRWDLVATPLCGSKVAKFEHLMQRVELAKVQAMFVPESAIGAPSAPAASLPAASPAAPPPPRVAPPSPGAAIGSATTLEQEPLAGEISIEEFQKVDLRVAQIVAAEAVPEAKKLLRLTLSLGSGPTRNVFAGIKGAYEPAALVGRLVVMVANLAPRKMKFGLSEGMVVAAGTDGEVFLLSPDAGARPGHRLH
jgi:methionyl-tRNA synthetase